VHCDRAVARGAVHRLTEHDWVSEEPSLVRAVCQFDHARAACTFCQSLTDSVEHGAVHVELGVGVVRVLRQQCHRSANLCKRDARERGARGSRGSACTDCSRETDDAAERRSACADESALIFEFCLSVRHFACDLVSQTDDIVFRQLAADLSQHDALASDERHEVEVLRALRAC